MTELVDAVLVENHIFLLLFSISFLHLLLKSKFLGNDSLPRENFVLKGRFSIFHKARDCSRLAKD